jgi:pSer/pThr/pTyr-binding forkhead associated (FHA) protein
VEAQRDGFLRLEKGQVDGFENIREIRLSQGMTVIGRPSADSAVDLKTSLIRVNDDYISRGHLKIGYNFEEQCFMIEERESGTQNGTFINGDRINPGMKYRIKDGDQISLAKVGEDFRVLFRFRERENTLTGTPVSSLVPKGNLIVDIQARKVLVGSHLVALRRKEFDLLAFLFKNAGKACSRNEIAQQVWAEEGGIVAEETIDTVIHRIREKIEEDPSNPKLLVTLPRYGFRLDF